MSGEYDFSQLFHGSVLAYSPGTTFLAAVYQNRLIVRSTATLQIVRTWSCHRPQSARARTEGEQVVIDSVQWSNDSMYILAHSVKSKLAWVFGLAEDGSGDCGEIAQIGGEGPEGLVRVEWGRGANDVLAWSDYALKLSIHDLSSGTTRVIQAPKSSTGCHTYSPDDRYLAVAEVHHGKEHVGVYDILDGHSLFRHFPLSTTNAQGIAWSPCGKYIAAWDSVLSYSVYVHSPLGPLLTHFSPASPTFSPSSSSEDPGLGVRTAAWAPGGRWLALGGYDGRVRIIESEGWRCIAVLQWGSRIVERDVTVWREPSDWIKDTRGRGIVQFDRVSLPAMLPTIRSDMSRPNPRVGVSHLSFDRDGTLLSVRLDSSPHVVHVHTFLPTPGAESPSITHLTSLVFAHPVRKAEWCPSSSASSSDKGQSKRMAIVTKSPAVYFWDGEAGWVEEGQDGDEAGSGGILEGVGVPANADLEIQDIQWAPDGSSLLVQDKGQFCVLYDDVGDGSGHATTYNQPEGLTHIEEGEEELEEGWSGYGLQIREGLFGREVLAA
ncbi:hypothetical protein IAU60_002563 [Kwoniella sp. DSM 27419]